MTHEEKERIRQGKVAWAAFEHAVENIPEYLRDEFYRSCFIDTAQKTILKNCLGNKAVLAKELCDMVADFVRNHQLANCLKE